MQVLWIVIPLALFALTVWGLINTRNNKNSVSPIIFLHIMMSLFRGDL